MPFRLSNRQMLSAGALLAFALAAAPAPSQPAQSLAALKAWLAVFDRGDSVAYKAFLQSHFPKRVASAEGDMQFRKNTGGFVLRKIESTSPGTSVALLQEALSDQFARLTVTVDPAQPDRIDTMRLRITEAPAEFAIVRLPERRLLESVRSKIALDVRADRFAGAVAVARNGKIIFSQAYGLADRERGIPNTTRTRFRIGSMNKMFTAVAIMQLVEAGKVRLSDTLGKYLPDYPNKGVAGVTVAQLLTHTGGTGDIFGPDYEANRLKLRGIADYIRLYGERPLLFKPGSRWDYSNYGFVLLGAIVERASGEDYYAYVRRHIYAPAGMTSTGSLAENEAVSDRSIGYTKMDGAEWKSNADTLPFRGSPAGGGYSTVGDLLAFASALDRHKLLNPYFTTLMTTGKVTGPGGSRYGYGIEDLVVNGMRCFGHNGGAPGMNGELKICGDGYSVAVLANVDPPGAERVADFIAARLPAGTASRPLK